MVMTDESRNRRFTEDLDIAGHQLIETVRRLIAEGNVSRLRIRAEDGSVFLEIPLTAGAVAGGVIVLTAPWLAAIGAIAGLATKVKIEIVRDTDQSDDGTEPPV
tara:strand:- start:12000 stop:12311 length:312 start_codon:yes stop_codon:yes gene_type:complete